MKHTLLAVLTVALAGCAPQTGPYSAEQLAQWESESLERLRQVTEQAAAAERALTPAERTARDNAAAKTARENELLERALTNSPDYAAAIRRAAIANVDAEPPQPGRRVPREQRITAEESRLSDAIEVRRRQRMQTQANIDQTRRDIQAEANCRARGQAIEAAYYDRRSLLNLEAALNGNQAMQECLSAYRRTR
ncbi:hypothetical protein ACQW02_25655 [Humitalea sp. 24SJ18S-53]|uniref:hypothetical protein n=1 Tax=Humitalea sp. 24SJ18S-53 TaxID=3422307 RepID=UPI003D66B210